MGSSTARRALYITFGRFERLNLGEQDDELVPAHPGDSVACSDGVVEPARNFLEHGVAGVVAMVVVDLLEQIQIADADCDPDGFTS